jgi:hypothetical protein
MSPEGDREGTNGRPAQASTAGDDASGSAASSRNMLVRILRAATRTAARNRANEHRSSSMAAPTLSDAFSHGLRGTGASATSLKGTDATASRRVRGTLSGQP